MFQRATGLVTCYSPACHSIKLRHSFMQTEVVSLFVSKLNTAKKRSDASTDYFYGIDPTIHFCTIQQA